MEAPSSVATIREAVIGLLEQLIAIPSFSREESGTADCIEAFLRVHGVACMRSGNNVWARAVSWRSDRPTVLLNSHHDTVRPVQGWTKDPFQPTREGDMLFGLGSNDAGGPLVSLIAAFLRLQAEADLPVNLLLAATAEEEISGAHGIAALLSQLGHIDYAIVGEPTRMQMAVAEKGLMVVDAEAKGVAGHAAREEGVNAIYLAMDAIQTIRNLQPEQVSPLLGKVKMSVTQIEAGKQHNVVPDSCRFVIDIRTNELYQNEAFFKWLQQQVKVTLTPRSFRLNSSRIAMDHPLVQSGLALGLEAFGSPTLSDQALMPFPSLKIGCGDSARSHTADEYIRLSEIADGIQTYIQLIRGIAPPSGYFRPITTSA